MQEPLAFGGDEQEPVWEATLGGWKELWGSLESNWRLKVYGLKQRRGDWWGWVCAEMGFTWGQRGTRGEVNIAGEVIVESICFGRGGGGEVCRCTKTKRCNGQVTLSQQKDLCPNEVPADCSNTTFRSSAKLHHWSSFNLWRSRCLGFFFF